MQATLPEAPPEAPPARRIRRVWVVGSCGSGKTTVAERVAEVLDTRPVHIDDFRWQPGWQLREREEMLELLEARLADESWVMEGNLGRDATRLWAIIDSADLVIWLDLPFPLTLLRLARRSLRRALLRRPCCNGNYESLRRSFFSRHSILLYAWRTRRLRAVIYGKLLRHRRHVRLRSTREVRGFLEALGLAGEARARRGG